MRKKKKEGPIQKIIRLVHKIMLGVVIVAALHILFKFSLLGLKFKFWLLKLGYFLVHIFKVWASSKHHKHPTIHYEDVHHAHHYPHVEDEVDDHEDYLNEHEYLGPYRRSEYAHNLAYAQQKPEVSVSSWFG